MSRVNIFIVAMMVWLGVRAQPNSFSEVFNQPAYYGATVAFKIIDVDSSLTLYEQNAQLALTPASIMKLVTTATALEVLGADFQFRTTLYIKGNIKDSILYGDVVIVGGGDPTLGSRFFSNRNPLEDFRAALFKKGIKTIKGNIIADDSHFSEELVADTWVWGDLGNAYGTGISGLNYNDNTVFLEFSSGNVGDTTKIISLFPNYDVLKFKNWVTAQNINSDQAYIFGSPYDEQRLVKGSIPKNRASFKVKGSVPNPTLFTASVFKLYLDSSKMNVSGSVLIDRNIHKDSSLVLVKKYFSPKLKDIVFQTNQFSVNHYAEALARELGRKSGSGSFSDGAKYITKYWEKQGVDVSFLFIEDGSGLSRHSALSPNTMIRILELMYLSENKEAFQNSLPVAGKSGTLINMLKDTHAENNLKAKSGSMTRVRTYAGYVKSKSGRNLAFVIMVNNYSNFSLEIRKDLEKFMQLVSEI
ncbi:MAG: D-alanyl-D-alanine carboxypeptidase/D-alanyl-D-alanine-endopeptidase [Bacteroidia bacterium]